MKKDYHIFEDFLAFPSYEYAREYDNVLQIIYIDVGSIGFTCDLAIQPLVVPMRRPMIIHNFRVRVPHYFKLGFERWDYGHDIAVLQKNIKEMLDIIDDKGHKWLTNHGSELGVVNYPIEDGSLVWCNPGFKGKYRGFCALHQGLWEIGINNLKSAIEYLETLPQERYKEEIEKLDSVIWLANNDRIKLKEQLNLNIDTLRSELLKEIHLTR